MFASNLGFRSSSSTPPGNFGNNAFWGSTFNTNRQLQLAANTQTNTDWNNLTNYSNTNGFTIEYWIYPTAWTVPDVTYGSINPGPGAHNAWNENYWSLGGISGNKLQLFFFNANFAPFRNSIETASNTLPLNQWSNICAVFTSNGTNTTVTLYINGTREQIDLNQSGTFTNSITFADLPYTAPATNLFALGNYDDLIANNALYGFTDNLRVSNINRYSGASYTVATAPFVSDANTQLIIEMDGVNGSTTFTDDSSIGWTVNNPSNLVVISNSRADHT